METLSGKPLLRRVLASLPAWYSEEDEARLDAEAAREGHVRARRHSFDEMVSEMQGNPHALIAVEASTTAAENRPQSRPMTAEEVQRCLDWLQARGWVSVEETVPLDPDAPGTRFYRMTQAGFDELHRPEAAPENVVPGPVEIKPQTATEGVHAEMGVSADA
jgi:hypothetical protein